MKKGRYCLIITDSLGNREAKFYDSPPAYWEEHYTSLGYSVVRLHRKKAEKAFDYTADICMQSLKRQQDIRTNR